MSLLFIIALALIQGVTEFLPISSTAHLILLPQLTHKPDQQLVMDVSMHMGTLGAVLLYFRRDCEELLKGFLDFVKRRETDSAKMGKHIVIATIPVVVMGFLFKDIVAGNLRNIELLAWTMLLFGIVLGIADRKSGVKELHQLTHTDALWIGLAQMLALIPGVSRSGITMTAALFLGLKRTDAAKFSMLLAIPTILGAGILMGVDLMQLHSIYVQKEALIGASLAFVVAFITIACLMRWLEVASMMPFVIYRVVFGTVLLVWAY